MKSQGIDDDTVLLYGEEEFPDAQDNAAGRELNTTTASESLKMLLERLPTYFYERATKDDIETLIFCLHSLFCRVDTLYRTTLPALMAATITEERILHDTLERRYRIWTQLQEVQQLLESIESLCHLLNRTTPRVLAVLDITSSSESEPAAALSPVGSEQWQQAYETLTTHLGAWQEQNEQRLSFISNFSAPNSSLTGPLLTQTDVALTLLLDSAGAIFGDIIPDFQVISSNDDEAVATLLFDLLQQVDLLLMQRNLLVETMHELIQHYTIQE